MSSVGIVSYGVYIPKYRIKREDIGKAWKKRGKGENSLANVDEDAVTMSVEASENAIDRCGLDPVSQLNAFYFASASFPYIEQSSIGVIAEAVGCIGDVEMSDFAQTTRASAAALKACSDAVAAGRIKNGLAIGSDWRSAAPGSDQEMNFGAAAAAFLIGKENVIAEIEGSASYNDYFMETWRGVDQKYVNLLELRYSREFGYENHVKEAAKLLMAKLGKSPGDFQHLVLQYPSDARRMKAVARELGFKPEQLEKAAPAQSIGDTGNASVPLGIAAVLDQAKPGERILAVYYGSGITDAISFVVKGGIEKIQSKGKSVQAYLDGKAYVDYITFMKKKGSLVDPRTPIMTHVRSDAPFWSRSAQELFKLTGNKCRNCGNVNYPPSQKKICIRCRGTDMELVDLNRKGKIYTYYYDEYAPPPIPTPCISLIITLDDGTTFRALGTEMEIDEAKIGTEVEIVLRRVTLERGISNYGRAFARLPR